MIHVAITRTVREGRQPEFERRVAEFFADAQRDPGVEGAYLLRPVDPGSREYGVVRTFADEVARDRFYGSDLYRDFDAQVAPLVEGPARKREIHGLGGLFTREDEGGPPAWKMAVVTWIGVNPAVFVFSNLVPRAFGELPSLVTLLVVNLFVVASLTWVLMPVLTRAFARWLWGREKGTSS